MIELEGVPELVDPVMVAAFEGWNDAGDAASTAVGHMEREWKGEVFAALDAEDYYDFQVNRPQVWLDGGSRKITWPTTRLAVVRVDDAGGKGRPRDLVLVRGIEPSMRWRSFCNELLGFAHELGVEMVVVLGALLGDTPHSRPVPVTGVTSDPDLARTMNLEESRYEGPTGIVGILQEACTHAGVPALSLWASVPHYVSQPPNPKATLALLNRLEDLLELNVPLGELQEDARAWQLGVDQLAAEDSEVAEYVQSLEEARDTAELPEASGEAIAKEFERYLRKRNDGPAGAGGSREPGGGSPSGFGGEAPKRGGSGRSRGSAPPAGDGADEGPGEAERQEEAGGESPDDKGAGSEGAGGRDESDREKGGEGEQGGTDAEGGGESGGNGTSGTSRGRRGAAGTRKSSGGRSKSSTEGTGRTGSAGRTRSTRGRKPADGEGESPGSGDEGESPSGRGKTGPASEDENKAPEDEKKDQSPGNRRGGKRGGTGTGGAKNGRKSGTGRGTGGARKADGEEPGGTNRRRSGRDTQRDTDGEDAEKGEKGGESGDGGNGRKADGD